MNILNPKPILCVLLSSLLLSAAWYVHPFFSFLGFIPVLYLIHNEEISGKKRFLYLYLTFLFWNILTTWWIVNSTYVGSTLAYVLNSLLMCIPVFAYRKVYYAFYQSRFKLFASAFTLCFFWLSFEYLHMQWDLTWPWLNLGNSFGHAHVLVQWYAYTGTLGGTLWVLLINILIYNYLKNSIERKKALIAISTVVSIPIFLSLLIYVTYSNKGTKIEVVVVQPNIDPYNEKFSDGAKFMPYNQQLDRLITLSKQQLTQNTTFLFWPETSIPQGYDEALMSTQPEIFRLKDSLAVYPNLTLITGADTYKIYNTEFDKSETARFQDGVGWYDFFNTAIKINKSQKLEFYHKSKLVPGVERMPYPALFKWLNAISIDMGGMTGSLGTQENQVPLANKSGISAAPIICYESIFGEHVSEYVKNGALLLAVITNDGWWGDTPGHTQHLAFSRLRAIENRRSVARAANTGISCFIDQKGDITENTNYWVQDVRKAQVNLNPETTFYTLYGDYLGKFSFFIALALVFACTVVKIFKL